MPMRNDYKYLYRQPHPIVPASRGSYSDPVWTEAELRADAARIARNRAAIRRARVTERFTVCALALMLLLTVLPAAAVALAAVAAAPLSRRLIRLWRQRRIIQALPLRRFMLCRVLLTARSAPCRNPRGLLVRAWRLAAP
jgi:hypothetical protein